MELGPTILRPPLGEFERRKDSRLIQISLEQKLQLQAADPGCGPVFRSVSPVAWARAMAKYRAHSVRMSNLAITMPRIEAVHLLGGRGNLGPVLHLHTREEAIFASFRLEDRCLAFLDVEPVFSESIEDVWLARDENVVRALVGHPGQHVAQSFGPSVVLVRRHDEAALGQIDGRLDLLEAGQHGGLVGAIELARVDLSDRNSCRSNRVAERLGKSLALGIEIALLGDVREVERIGVGLVAERRPMPHEYY